MNKPVKEYKSVKLFKSDYRAPFGYISAQTLRDKLSKRTFKKGYFDCSTEERKEIDEAILQEVKPYVNVAYI